MSFKNTEKEIDLHLVYEISRKMNFSAETKTYYALALIGLLSVPLFSLFIKMLELKLFNSWWYKILFMLSFIFFIISLIALLFSLVPKFYDKLLSFKRKTAIKTIEQIYNDCKSDYYNYRFWGKLKFLDIEKVIDFLNKENTVFIGSVTILKQIIDIAWIAKKKFNAFDLSISLQTLLIISMFTISMLLIFKG